VNPISSLSAWSGLVQQNVPAREREYTRWVEWHFCCDIVSVEGYVQNHTFHIKVEAREATGSGPRVACSNYIERSGG
jgi:hypothetical protein